MKRPFEELDPCSKGPDETDEELIERLEDDLRALGVSEAELEELRKD